MKISEGEICDMQYSLYVNNRKGYPAIEMLIIPSDWGVKKPVVRVKGLFEEIREDEKCLKELKEIKEKNLLQEQ